MAADDRTMFEIFRESDYNRSYHYIFYTDLDEHAREAEIARAANGETVFAGFLHDATKENARSVVEAIVEQLNEAEEDVVPSLDSIRTQLADFLAPAP